MVWGYGRTGYGAFRTARVLRENLDAPALVLDRLVQGWLRHHADCEVRLTWHVGDCRRYLELATAWATTLGVAPADVEYLMFADAADEPGSQWSPSPPATTTADSSAGGEVAAVLDALDEAANAFAALPGDANPADLDDFEHALRHLRRIVLARTARPEGIPLDRP